MTASHPVSADATLSLPALRGQSGDQAPLSAAGRDFNDKLTQIERLSRHIDRLQAWADRHQHAHIQALQVSMQWAQVQRKNMLLFLHARLQMACLSVQHQRMARAQLRSLLAQLGTTGDPQVQAVAAAYLNEDDMQAGAQEQAQAAQRLRQRIEQALGQPIQNPSQYPTPEAMMQAGMRQWQRQQAADEARKAAKRAARKAQKQAQKKNAAAEKGEVPLAELRQADAQSVIRTVFRQLASALHPDREPDEQERLRKTGWMSEVNAAYAKNDLSTLLRLQMQVTALNPQNTARMADDKLIAMSLLLKVQVAALQDDLDQLQNRLSCQLCVPVRADVDEVVLTQALQRIRAEQQHMADSLAADLRRIQNDAELKPWLKAQWQLSKATSA